MKTGVLSNTEFMAILHPRYETSLTLYYITGNGFEKGEGDRNSNTESLINCICTNRIRYIVHKQGMSLGREMSRLPGS